MSIVWLASYPKSGNTWFRALLTNYLQGGPPAFINALVGAWKANDRELFNELMGLDSSELTADELLRHRPAFHVLLAEALPSPTFMKVHEAFLPVPAPRGAAASPDRWLFSGVEAAVVYLVRNPLDVAVSYAHHRDRSIDDAIEWMNNPHAVEGEMRGGLTRLIPQPLTTWSGHVSSWLGQHELRCMLSNTKIWSQHQPRLSTRPCASLNDIAQSSRPDAAAKGRMPQNAKQRTAALATAVDHAAFRHLQTQEAREGFYEKQPTALSFFRAGAVGDWREALTATQVHSLVEAHGAVMAQLGYLAEAQAFLADAGANE